MTELKVTGGGEIGNAHGTYPFASLTITSYKLQLTISLVGTVVFRPSDIISIELHESFLGIRKGIIIKHRVSKYSPDIIFRPTDNAAFLIQRIHDSGFLINREPLPEAIEEEIRIAQSSGSFPIKTSAAVGIVIGWNVLCIPAILNDSGKHSFLRFPGAMLFPLAFLSLFCLSLLFVPHACKMVLKKGHSFPEIKTGIIFILCIVCFMLIPLMLLIS